ncbi:uncharacterized protein [Anolis sagrei]|uniref:uncharacterized protein n=1 Tax=Anolis sagrei TaxID=38937 RepID=UPI00351F8268
MKRRKRVLESVWRSDPSESNRTRFVSFLRAYAAAIKAAKKTFFAATIASAKNRPAELFRVVRGLLTPPISGGSPDNSAAHCEAFARFFADKVALIRSGLDATLDAVSVDVTQAPACPILLDSFQFVKPEDVDKILGGMRPTTSILDPCPSWLLKEARGGLAEWVTVVVNASLREGKIPASLKQAVIKPLLKKPSLDPTKLDNFRPVSNLPFLGKVMESVVASQLQVFLRDTDYLDPAQSGFRPGHGTETVLVALVDDLRRELDRGSVSLLVLLDLSAAFDTVDHGILLGRLAEMGLGGTALQWLRSFLEGRTQKVLLGDSCSTPQPLTCGVPQGSILSPLLFNIYMKPLGEIIRSFGVRCHLYADDVQLCHSFPPATSRLDYCNALYVGLPLKTARKLQLVQRAAAMLLTGAGRREHTTPLLSQLHWLPIRYRAQFKVLVLSYKALNGSGPKYLADHISAYEPTRALRSSGEALLSVPPASQVRLAGTRERAFSVVAPRLWNTLPAEVRQAPSLMAFRRGLKTWLFEQAFN